MAEEERGGGWPVRPRPLPRTASCAVWAAAILAVCAITALDLAFRGTHRGIMVGLVSVPALTLLSGRNRHPLWTGGLALGAAVLVGMIQWRDRPVVVLATLANIVLLTLVALRAESYRGARGRPGGPPPAAGPGAEQGSGAGEGPGSGPESFRLEGLRLELRCLPLPPLSRMSADFCDLRQTAWGARILVVDFMGKDESTRAAAEQLLYRWRRLAGHEQSLAETARRLDAELAAYDGIFAKALLLNIAGGERGELVCCGHPPPVLLGRESGAFLNILAPSPPLGLFPLVGEGCPVYTTTFALGPDRQLLICTDGVTDARDPDGRCYPLADRAGELAGREPGVFLDRLTEDVRLHLDGRARDEAMLMLVESDQPAALCVVPPARSEEGGSGPAL